MIGRELGLRRRNSDGLFEARAPRIRKRDGVHLAMVHRLSGLHAHADGALAVLELLRLSADATAALSWAGKLSRHFARDRFLALAEKHDLLRVHGTARGDVRLARTRP